MDNRFLKEYDASYDEDNRLTSRHGSVEFLTTTRYIDRYLSPGMELLEVGAGTGRYSLHYAAKDYRVEAVELVETNVARFREHIVSGMDVHAHQGDACDLSGYSDGRFDVTAPSTF